MSAFCCCSSSEEEVVRRENKTDDNDTPRKQHYYQTHEIWDDGRELFKLWWVSTNMGLVRDSYPPCELSVAVSPLWFPCWIPVRGNMGGRSSLMVDRAVKLPRILYRGSMPIHP